MARLTGKKVAVLMTDGVEQVELTSPVNRLKEEGAQVTVVSIKEGNVKGWDHDRWGEEFEIDALVEHVSAIDFDALLLPGGVINPDKLRMEPHAVAFVKDMYRSDKPIAAICHGPWMLVEAGVVRNRTLTSWPSLQTDIRNAGGNWVDQEVVVDQGLVTSRKPQDLNAFNEKMVEEFAEGVHERDHADLEELTEAMSLSV